MAFSLSSKTRLTMHDADRFAGDTIFDRLARAVCAAGCLPRKELYESWETARRARRLFRGGRVVDLGGGHGLLAHVMLVLDSSSPSAIVADRQPVASAPALHDALVAVWPHLAGRVSFQSIAMEEVELASDDVVVSNHACGALTDVVLERAAAARARVAVLPCCHDFKACDAGNLSGWLDPSLAIDVMRATRLRERGYRIWTQTIPGAITPKNRLLLGAPDPGSGL
jgi:hypothetical protein